MPQTKSFSKSFYPWCIWLLLASFFYYKYLIQVSPGVMSEQLMSAFSLSGAGLGHLAACFFYAYLLMQIPVGIILDRWSPRYVTAVAALLCAVAIYCFAQSDSLFTAGMSRFVIGLGASFAAVACFKITSMWFPPRRFALVAGLSMTAAMFGAVGGEGPLAYLVESFGWRHALELVAIPGVFLALLIWLVVRDKPVARDAVVHGMDSTPLSAKFAMILKDRQTWIIAFYGGLAFAPLSVFGGLWGVAFIQKAFGLQHTEAANLISLIFIGFALGCPVAGWASDYIGRRKPVMAMGTVVAFLCMGAILYIPMSKAVLSAMLFCFGLGASCFFICFSMIRELHPAMLTATVLGFMNTFNSIWEAFTEPLVGRLLDLNWSGQFDHGARAFSVHDYQVSLLALPIYLAIAMGLLFFIKETFCQQKEHA